jgi:hypothetical protein
MVKITYEKNKGPKQNRSISLKPHMGKPKDLNRIGKSG